jgi:hypothetical protein
LAERCPPAAGLFFGTPEGVPFREGESCRTMNACCFCGGGGLWRGEEVLFRGEFGRKGAPTELVFAGGGLAIRL